MAWLQVEQTLSHHKKLLQATELLKCRRATLVGHLVLLWLWALDNAPDGRLDGVADSVIAAAADISPSHRGLYLETLVEVGFLDRVEGGLRIHGWADYGGRLQEHRRKNAERKRKKRLLEEGDVRGTDAAVPHIEYTTQDESRATQSSPEQSNTSSGCGGGEGARESESAVLREYLHGRGLLPETYFGADPALIAQTDALTSELFAAFARRVPTALDRARVFCAATRYEGGERAVDADLRDLLAYAFEAAAAAGAGGSWPYIEGVLARLAREGVHDLAGVEYKEADRRR